MALKWVRSNNRFGNSLLLFSQSLNRNIGIVIYDGMVGREDPLKYRATTDLSGISKYFKTEEEGKAYVWKLVTHLIRTLYAELSEGEGA